MYIFNDVTNWLLCRLYTLASCSVYDKERGLCASLPRSIYIPAFCGAHSQQATTAVIKKHLDEEIDNRVTAKAPSSRSAQQCRRKYERKLNGLNTKSACFSSFQRRRAHKKRHLNPISGAYERWHNVNTNTPSQECVSLGAWSTSKINWWRPNAPDLRANAI